MNCPQAGGLVSFGRQMKCGQNDSARVGVAGSQVVKEVRRKVGAGIGIEDEKIRFHAQHQLLCLLQTAGKLQKRVGRGFLYSLTDRSEEHTSELQSHSFISY